MNYCYVFIGPSGSGKTSLAEAIFQPEQKIITYTNRSPRPGEKDQEDYYFVSDNTFNQMIKEMSLQSGTNMLNINMVPVKQKLKRN